MEAENQARQRIMVVDDDAELLELYSELLGQIPTNPEIVTANSGGLALTLLEEQPIQLVICDLKMPKMDGLQVLSIIRRKHPEVRTIAISSLADEQFRSRAYALGVDMFWQKPATDQERKQFLDCLESLLGQAADTGFRGVQSKSLVDIVQLECLSNSSSVLRITNGSIIGKIWIQDGEVIDSETGDLQGEAAFQRILSWRAGAFEALPAEPGHPRTILKSYNGLLLESAQAIDESRGAQPASSAESASATPLQQVAKIAGVEFVVALEGGHSNRPAARGLENPERLAAWARESLAGFRNLGEKLRVGELEDAVGLGVQHGITLARQGETDLCVGWIHSLGASQLREEMKKVVALWAS